MGTQLLSELEKVKAVRKRSGAPIYLNFTISRYNLTPQQLLFHTIFFSFTLTADILHVFLIETYFDIEHTYKGSLDLLSGTKEMRLYSNFLGATESL